MEQYIKLNNGGYAVVDEADYEYLSQFEWRKKKSDGTQDTYHAVRDVEIGGKKITIRMHRLITEAKYDQFVFHINEDGLDNRRRNLQLRTLKPWTGRPGDSGFHGVHQMSTNKWRAEISFAGRKHVIGESFMDPSDAARAYDNAARRLYGTNAITNFHE